MSVPYKNPISSVQISTPQSVSRTSVFGTNFSILNVGGYMEVYNLSDLSLTLTASSYPSLIQLSANTIPIRFTKGNGTFLSPDYLTLNSDNISSGRRRIGMMVYVHETDKVYQYVIPNYETLWNNLSGLTGFSSVTYSDYTTVVNNRSSAGQAFIEAWTASTIEGVSGYTSSNANWRIFQSGSGTSGSSVYNSTGVFEFSGLSKVSSTQFSVAPVKGWIVDDTTNPLSPQILYVDYSGGTHTDSYVTTANETFVYLTSGGTIQQQPTILTEQQRRQNIFLGKLGHPDKTTINLVFSQPDSVLSPLGQLRDILQPINLINGNVYPSPNTGLTFNTSFGYLYGLGINFANNILNPNSITIPATNPCTFQYRTQTGGSITNVTNIDPLYYDVGGVKTALTGTKATNQRIYLLQNGTFRVQYGQHEYNNFADAIQALQTETFTVFPNFTNNAVLIGILTVLSTATDLNDTSKAQFFFASKFGETIGAAGGVSTTNLQQAYNNSTSPEIIINSTLDGLSIKNGTGNADNITNLLEGINSSGNTTSFIRSDGTISGNSISAVTISATTYLNLPLDIRVTGGTKSGSNVVFTNNTGGTFTVTGFTDTFVTGGTKSGSVVTFRNNSGGTFTVTGFTDTFVTGGTFNSGTGVTTFTNNTGGTFNVSGYFTPTNDIYVTGGTIGNGPSNAENKITLNRSNGTDVILTDLVEIVNLTKTDMDTLISDSKVIRGKTYKISGCDISLYNNGTYKDSSIAYTTIYLMGLQNDKLSESGVGIFYTPKYKEIAIFIEGNTYSSGDYVIWGGYVWKCNTNGTYYSIDIFTLPVEFDKQYPFKEDDNYNKDLYNEQYDDIIFDYPNNKIIYRNEQNTNIVSTTTDNIDYWVGFLLYNPIRVFQWGNIYSQKDTIGIGNQRIINSYNENINYTGKYQINFYFNNLSYQRNVFVDSKSYQKDFIFDNQSYQENINISDGAYQSYINLINNSYQTNVTLFWKGKECFQNYLNFNNNSYQDNIQLTDYTQVKINLTNGSYQNILTNILQSNIIIDGGSQSSNSTPLSQNNITIKQHNRDLSSLSSDEDGIYFIHDLPTNNTAPVYIGKINNQLVEMAVPAEVFVTGATYSNNTFTYRNNTGGTFSVLFNTVTGLTVNGNLTVTGTTSSPTFTGNSLTLSSSASTINLNNPTQQQIRFFSGGTGAPQLSTYSPGVKIILNDNINSSISTGMAIGVDTGILWYGTDLTGNGHEWYAGTRKLIRLTTSEGYQLLGLGGPTTVAFTISGTSSLGSKGGTGYMDFLRVVNNWSASTNTNKWFRTNNIGTLEILNSNYTSTILTISDNGILSVGGGNPATVSSNDGQTNYLSFNNNASQIYDDGNFHIHSRAANQAMWINSNNGLIILGAQSPVSGGNIATGISIASSTQNGYVTINTGRTITTSASYGYLTTGGAGTYPGGSQSVTISLYANNRIWGQEIDAFSDERMKDIEGDITLEDGLNLIKNLKPIKYRWKEGDDKGIKAGYSAQQVIKSGFDHLVSIIPNEGLEETVDEDGFMSPKDTQFSMNYDQVTPYHGVVIKYLLEQIDELKEEIRLLKK